MKLSVFKLFFVIMFAFTGMENIYAQETQDSSKKECCLMKNGKMMHMKNGNVEAMESEMIMKNGTKCMANGECITQQGEKLILKDGECMDAYGNISICATMLENKVPENKAKKSKK